MAKRDPKTLEVAEPFRSLFPVEPETLALVKDSIRERGFQMDKPILAWRDAFKTPGRYVVVDGHTRLRAALDLKLAEVPVTGRQYKSVDDAITAGIGEQVQRRNLNREQIAAYVIGILPMLDETGGGLRMRTAKDLAEMLGVSKPTVDRARSLLDSSRTDLVDAVKHGEMSLLAAWQESLDVPILHPAPAAEPEPTAGEEETEATVFTEEHDVEQPIRGQVTVDEAIAETDAVDEADPGMSSAEVDAWLEGIEEAIDEAVTAVFLAIEATEEAAKVFIEYGRSSDWYQPLMEDLRYAEETLEGALKRVPRSSARRAASGEVTILGPHGGTSRRFLESHPLADPIPPMTDEELKVLIESVAESGVLSPLVLFEGKVLDGRQRLRAALATGKPVQVEEFDGSDKEALALLVSLNVSKRHIQPEEMPAVKAKFAKENS